MLLLTLDTCLQACSAAVYDMAGQKLVASRRELMDRGHAEVLPVMVDDVLKASGVKPGDLARIAVTVGPGTFTGIRIGLALAQGLALPRATPLLGLGTLIATAAPVLPYGRPVTVCHQAGATGKFYVQHFNAAGDAVSDATLAAIEDITVPPDAILVGTGSQALAMDQQRMPQFDLPDAAAFAAFASTLSITAKPRLDYIRPPDAKKPQAKMPSIRISRVGADAAHVLATLHAAGFPQGWSAAAVAEMLSVPGTLALVVDRDGHTAGMVMARAIGEESEILTFATLPRFRRQGLARQLLSGLEMYLSSLAVNVIHLEVASDNAAAIALYESSKFQRSGLRKRYYASGADAIVMQRKLP